MAMLDVDHQHGRQQSNEPGADTGVLGWQWRDAIYGAGASGGGWLGGTDAGAARVGQPEPARQGIGGQYVARMTGMSRVPVTRWIASYVQTGRVAVTKYERKRFSARYTESDVNLLACVDQAHGSGPATQRILEREHDE